MNKIMMIIMMIAGLVLLAGVVNATPFLTNDAQCFSPDSSDSACPDGYEGSDDGGATWFAVDSTVTETSIVIWHDLGGMPIGPNEWLLKATNVWGESDAVPFDFSTGVPAGPGGLRIVAPPTGN